MACGGDKKESGNNEQNNEQNQGSTGEKDPQGGEEKPGDSGEAGGETGGSSDIGDDPTDEEGKLTVGEDEDGENYGEFFPV